MPNHDDQHRTLERIARRMMRERGLEPEFPPDAVREVASLGGPAEAKEGARDLRDLPWCSIDNDESRDLDQLSVALPAKDGIDHVLVAIADVDALVREGDAIDGHAQHNTTSVYTAGATFPMLPERLSYDWTSLNQDADRRAIVIDLAVDASGEVTGSEIFLALVRNRARLTYHDVAAWLDGQAAAPRALSAIAGLDENLRTQDRVAQRLGTYRHRLGALDLETIEATPVWGNGHLADLVAARRNRAKELIENLMIAANGATARFLESRGVASIRRVVRAPRRWPRIVEIAASHDTTLPADPDAVALSAFLRAERAKDPDHFPDLSLSIVKLLGAGEYAVERPGEEGPGHFGLAVRDYTHSTAPNRRYADLLTHRLLKAALAGTPPPYDGAALDGLAQRCTTQEDAASKVERQVRKAAAALLLSDRIGQVFDAIVTGAADKGTWVRVLAPPVEGRLVRGFEGADVGDRLRVRLTRADVETGFIDFANEAAAGRV